jgi:hypothetical protein
MVSFGYGSLGRRLLIVRGAPAGTSVLGQVTPLHFSRPRDALDFLRRLTAEPGSLALLRRLYAEDSSTPPADKERLLELLAWRLASGELKARIVTPAPAQYLGEPAPDTSAPGKAPTQDARPNPIVPMEYIILARRESNEAVDSTRRLNATINAIVFLGFARETPPSQIASSYPGVAETERAGIAQAAFDLDVTLQEIRYLGLDRTRPEPDVAPALVKTAELEHQRVSLQAARFADRIGALRFDRHDDDRERSVTMAEYPQVAGAEAKHLGYSSELLGESMGRLRYEPTLQSRESSPLAEEVRSLAAAQGAQTPAVVGRLGEGLSGLLFEGGFDARVRAGAAGSSDESGTPGDAPGT